MDITAVLKPPPADKVLTLLLRPAEETQAWQFLSSCIKVAFKNSITSAEALAYAGLSLTTNTNTYNVNNLKID